MEQNGLFDILCCPACRGKLDHHSNSSELACPRCAYHFPIVDGIPVLFPCDVQEKMPELFGRYWDSEEKAAMYDAQVEGTDFAGRCMHESEIHGLLSCLDLKNTGLLLDAGCGNGRFLEALPGDIVSVGVDASLNLLRIARRKGRGRFHVCCELEHMPFSDNIFDTVISCRVLQHIRAQREAVAELCRILKIGGTVVIEVYNKWNLKTIYKNIRMSKFAKVLNKPFKLVFRSLSPFSDWGLAYDRYNSWLELRRWLKAGGADQFRGRGVGFGYHKYLFEPFYINAILDKRAPRLAERYYTMCSNVEQLIGPWVPFVFLMEKFVIAATKRAAESGATGGRRRPTPSPRTHLEEGSSRYSDG